MITDNNYQEKIKAAEYILKENGQLKEDLKQMKMQLNHWRNSTNDANQMLNHIGKQGVNRYADEFYNPALKRIVNTLYRENQVLVNKLSELMESNDPSIRKKHNITDYVKSNAELSESVKNLKLELEQKFKENRRLQLAIENTNKSGGQTEYGIEFIERLSNKCSNLQTENRNLKTSLLLQNDTMVYLKKVVDSLRNEFVEIFAKGVAENGQEFLDELKTLDTKGIPDFLLEPLRKDSATNTEEAITNIAMQVPIDISKLKIDTDRPEMRLDSGYASYNEELRFLTTSLKNSKQECEAKDKRINELNSELEKSMKKDKESQQVINDLLTNIPGSNDANLRNEVDSLKRKVENAKAECLSWSTALQEKDEEAKHFRRERDDVRKERDEVQGKYNNMIEAMRNRVQYPPKPPIPQYQRHQEYRQQHSHRSAEPYQTANWLDNPFKRDQVVADGPSSTRPKRQSSEPTFGTKYTSDFSSSPKRKSPIELGGDGDEFWKKNVEDVLQCEFCGEKYPCSILSEHLRTCDKKYDF